MKTIAQLNGVDFLRQCNKIRYTASDILKKTGIMEIRQRQPDYSECTTKEERLAKQNEKAKENLNDILDVLLDKYPEETIKLFELLIVKDVGEPELSGMDLTMIGLEVLSDKRVVDFLLSLMRLGQQVTRD